MDFKKQSEAFNERFGILTKHETEEEFEKFKRRILNIFDDIDSHIEERGIVKFCTYFARRVERLRLDAPISYEKNIYHALESETDKNRFFLMIETVFTLPIQTEERFHEESYGKNLLFKDVKEAIEISDINLSITRLKGEIILHPRGEKVLDRGLVDEVFSFLDPVSQRHLVAALKFFNKRSAESFIKSAESIRRCIEEFLRFKLGNSKGFVENIKELQQLLKGDQVSVEIRNIIAQIFCYLDKYFNENSKHNDGNVNEAENEFLLYQAGLLMRYISKVL